MKVYIEPRDWWVGYYRGDEHHYVCPLPTVVIRWDRKAARIPEPVIVPGATPFDLCTCGVCGPPWREGPNWREEDYGPFGPAWMHLCPTCGDKRCPGAMRHDLHRAGAAS